VRPQDSSVVRHQDVRVQRVVEFFDTLASPADLARLPQIYTADVAFKDPFNEVQGIDAVRGIFEHMFVQVHQPRFEVVDAVAQNDAVFVVWDFRFGLGSGGARRESLRGASHLRFDAAGLVTYHRDYWDPAEGLYEKLPYVGALFRAVRRRASR
jgi:steroid Delta-isomerase